jgi:hypothetical protein
MLLDSQLMFSNAQALTATAASTDVVTFVNDRDMGIGKNVELVILGSGTFASTNGTATLTVQVQYSEDNSTYVTAAQSDAMTITQLNSAIANNEPYLLAMPLPRPKKGTDTRPLYVRLNYVVGTQNFTAGTVTAGLAIGRDDVVYYPRNFSVTV